MRYEVIKRRSPTSGICDLALHKYQGNKALRQKFGQKVRNVSLILRTISIYELYINQLLICLRRLLYLYVVYLTMPDDKEA